MLRLDHAEGTLLPHQSKTIELILAPQLQGRVTSDLCCFVSADSTVLPAAAASIAAASPDHLQAARALLAAELSPTNARLAAAGARLPTIA